MSLCTMMMVYQDMIKKWALVRPLHAKELTRIKIAFKSLAMWVIPFSPYPFFSSSLFLLVLYRSPGSVRRNSSVVFPDYYVLRQEDFSYLAGTVAGCLWRLRREAWLLCVGEKVSLACGGGAMGAVGERRDTKRERKGEEWEWKSLRRGCSGTSVESENRKEAVEI